jgi:tetratricopeptide (TPR) repeat protein
MSRWILFACALCVLISPAFAAGDRAGSLEEAKTEYERGRYDEALRIYTDQMKEGAENGSLYYNAANCYLQKGGCLGKAIFFYEMARRFMPRDADIIANLRYARSLMKQPDTPPGGPFALYVLRKAFDGFTSREAFILWNACYFGSAALFVFSIFTRRFKLSARAMALLLLCMAMIMTVPLTEKISYEERAGVIVSAITDARLEPFEDSASKFPLYEGMEVRVLKAVQGWYKIRRPDGKIGWVAKDSLWRLSAPAF